MDARVGPYLSERVGAFYVGKQRSAVSVDCPNYVVVHVVGGAADANVGLELRPTVGGNDEQDLAEGALELFVEEYKLNELINPSEANPVDANASVVPQAARHCEADPPTMVGVQQSAFAV